MIAAPPMAGKTVRPPPLPEETFARVIRLASFNGRALVALAGTCAIFAALNRDAPLMIAGVMAVGMGVFELHGTNRLREGFTDGLNWVITCQMGLMLILIAFSGWRIANFDVDLQLKTLPPDVIATMEAHLRKRDIPISELPQNLFLANMMIFGLLATIAFFYQGAMALYYQKKRSAVALVLSKLR